jgi:hypothetical protein
MQMGMIGLDGEGGSRGEIEKGKSKVENEQPKAVVWSLESKVSSQ